MSYYLRQILALAVFLCATVAGFALFAGCSSSAPNPAPATVHVGGGTKAHAIHVFAKTSEGTVALAFAPATEAAFGGHGMQELKSLGLHPLGVNSGDGGTVVTPPPSVESPGLGPWDTAWALVTRAAEQCGYNQASIPGWYTTNPESPSWFVYWNSQPTCSDRLAIEQNLVCVADKLAALADAVGVTVWPAVNGYSGAYTYVDNDAGVPSNLRYAEWDIPPQADGDRFIVRDLAINTLSLLPVVDAYTDISFPSPMPTTKLTCGQAFGWLANAPVPTLPSCTNGGMDQIGWTVFGLDGSGLTPQLPPSTTPLCANGTNYANSIAIQALTIEGQILRSGGRLLHDVLRRNVYSDMAAAAQQAAQASDPPAGQQIAWGQSPVVGPYGTIAHASRTLLGRLEIGDSADFQSVADPACEGVSEINLLTGAMGNDLSARYTDPGVRTSGEATAMQFVERAGIVVPLCQPPFLSAVAGDGGGAGTAQSLKDALVAQLILEESNANGSPAYPVAASSLTGLVNGLDDGEVISAFARVERTWRLLTNTPAEATCGTDGGAGECYPVASGGGSSPFAVAGLSVYANSDGVHIHKLVQALGGVVVAGGMSRSRLSTDPMARAGGMSEASQCGTANTYWSEWGQDALAILSSSSSSNVGANGLSLPPVAELPKEVMQDPFHAAQAIERSLNLLQTASGAAAQTAADVSRGGIAELRSWAGTIVVHATPVGTTSNQTISSFNVVIGGVSGANFGAPGLATGAQVAGAYGFVYGPPWVAECAAHVRTDCPANFDGTYVQRGNSPATETTSSMTGTGIVDQTFTLNVTMGANLSAAAPYAPNTTLSGAASPSNAHLYMVQLHDPSSTSGAGHVLGTLPLRGHFLYSEFWGFYPQTVSLVDAPMQRELVHSAIDLGKWVGQRPPSIGDPSVGEPSGYCVDGVPRDIFVPLDNELISGTATYEDSWQHYLDLAQQAALTADTLGQQLIADDLQISENEQAAAQQLANICGDFGALSSATVGADGTITAGPEDPTTQQCISEPTFDIVFLGQMPASVTQAGSDPAAITTAIQTNILHCGTQNQPGSASQLCTRSPLKVAALKPSGTPPPTPQPPSILSPACGALVKLAPTFHSSGLSGPQLSSTLNSSELGTDAMATAAAKLSMVVDANNRWQVYLGKDQIMGSNPTLDAAYWPACLPHCAQPSVSALQEAMAPAWDAVFRDCTSAPSNPGDQTQYSLGCNSAPFAGNELNTLKHRVQHAIWTIAMSAGQLNAGTFQGPIPAIFPDSCQGGNCNNFCDGNNCVAYYPGGAFAYYPGVVAGNVACADGNHDCGILTTTDPDVNAKDSNAVGLVYPTRDASFGTFMPAASVSEIPFWYRNLFNFAGTDVTVPQTLTHVFASNDPATFNQCYLGGSCGQSSPPSYPLSLATLVGRSQNQLDGLKCAQNFSESGSTPKDNITQQPWWMTIAVAEAGYDRGTPSQQPGFWIFNQFMPQVPQAWWNVSKYWWGDTYYTPVGFGTSSYSGSQGLWSALGAGWDLSATSHATGGPFDIGLQFQNNPGALPPWPLAYTGGTVPPRLWSTGSRASLFYGADVAPNGTCGAAAMLLQAAALACTPSAENIAVADVNLGSLPQVTQLSDIPRLEAWLRLASQALNTTDGGFYAQDVPSRVVNDFIAGTVGSGALGGTKGQAILTMEQQFQAVPQSWTQIASDLLAIQGAINVANYAVVGAKLSEDTADGSLALQTIQVQGNMALAVGQFLETVSQAAGSAVSSLGGSLAVIPAAALVLATQESNGNAELNQLQNMASTASQAEQNQVSQVMAQLGTTTNPLWADVQKQIDALRAAAAQLDASGQAIIQSENQAAYEAALGTGQDFVTIGGQQVALPVNTVLRRQASATEKRYQAALTNAKALAYMARRAIEQRIGVKLETLTQQVGPLDAPASWADDICSLQVSARPTAPPVLG